MNPIKRFVDTAARAARVARMAPWAAAVALVALSGAAQAALIDRGGGLIYDSTRNLTWLADMNHARTSGHTGAGVNADGTMTWAAANQWAANLVYGGYDDWRLPTVNEWDASCSGRAPGPGNTLLYFGFNCTGGELSGLFVADLGNKANESVLDQAGDTAEQIANLALFSNVQSHGYWSALSSWVFPDSAWVLTTHDGSLGVAVTDIAMFAVAMRIGDVAAPVPEPQTLVLAMLALGATAVVRKRRARPGLDA